MVTNQIECNKLGRRSVLKFLMAEKCNAFENYRIVCDVYEEGCFSQ